jgi:protein ImuB
MPSRRILSLWFPRLGAERLLRRLGAGQDTPLAVVAADGNGQVLTSLSAGAAAAGLRPGQPLGDARAICPGLLTRPEDAVADAVMRAALCRWAGRFSPWVAEEPPDALLVDLTGCAHLFGGEAALMAQVEADCADLGLTVRAGLADTVGAAWALARFAGTGAAAARSGDAIDQEARATRSRAARRRGAEAASQAGSGTGHAGRIAPEGHTRATLASLPVAALRLDPDSVAGLSRLGLRRIGDLIGQPRAALARRFGQALVRRLDQALGLAPEPVSPARPAPRFALRLSLPDPIGLRDDLLAGIDRLLPEFETRLRAAGRGARRVRLEAMRCDHRSVQIEVGLARPSAAPDRIRPLLVMKLDAIDAGPGIDALRLSAPETEPVHDRQHKGHLDVSCDVACRFAAQDGLDDLIGKLGARIGTEAVTRLHPAASHIPEKTATVMAAAWAAPAPAWPAPPTPRPGLIWPPEPVDAPDAPDPPQSFRWRGRTHRRIAARGPERIAPEWWLDDPVWRNGVRDYWEVTTQRGERLWLYYAHGGTMSGGWFCQGAFT